MQRLISALAIAGVLSAASVARAQAPDFQTVLNAAKREGTLVVRITNPSLPQTHKALEEAFNKRFGLSAKLEWTPQGAPQTNTRVIAEAGSGRGSVDIVGLGSAEDVEALRSRGLVKTYPWVEVFGKELPGLEAAVNGVMADLRGTSFDLLDAVYGVGWNSTMLKDEEVPRKTTDLLDPKWRGKLSLNAFFLNPLPTVAYVIGQPALMDYARKLMENRPIMQKGSPVVMQALSVGQAPLGIITYHGAQRALQQGQPVKFRLFDDYVMVYEGLVYIPENAPNPNLARLFLAWLATEGTAVAAQFEAMPRLSDKGSDVARVVQQALDKGAKLAAPPSLAEVAAQAKLREDLTKLITSTGN
jgi:iron(III) transport system substrate-binding protein